MCVGVCVCVCVCVCVISLVYFYVIRVPQSIIIILANVLLTCCQCVPIDATSSMRER